LDFSAEDFEAYFTGFESMRARLFGHRRSTRPLKRESRETKLPWHLYCPPSISAIATMGDWDDPRYARLEPLRNPTAKRTLPPRVPRGVEQVIKRSHPFKHCLYSGFIGEIRQRNLQSRRQEASMRRHSTLLPRHHNNISAFSHYSLATARPIPEVPPTTRTRLPLSVAWYVPVR